MTPLLMLEWACTAGNGGGQLAESGDGVEPLDSGSHASRIPVPTEGDLLHGLDVGLGFACAMDEAGSLVCWGQNEERQSEPPPGEFDAVTLGRDFACARATSGGWECWGGLAALTGGPTGWAGSEELGLGYDYACVLDRDGFPACWGPLHTTEDITAAPTAVASALHVGSTFACAAVEAAGLDCWGMEKRDYLQPDQSDLSGVDLGWNHACGIDAAGIAQCWGWDEEAVWGPDDTPAVQVSCGAEDTCVVSSEGRIRCWGWHTAGIANREAPYTEVSLGEGLTCALPAAGGVECWEWEE